MLFFFKDPENRDDDFAFTKKASRENLEKTGEELKSIISLQGFDAISQLVNKILKKGTWRQVAKQIIFNNKHSDYRI